MKTHDKSWQKELGLGLNAIAVTAAACPCRTEIGNPSGKRHCNIYEYLKLQECEGFELFV